ncbi:MAG: AAA family ATPase [Saprospiraceae bacterium]|nr:AAA family ATPase [Saprospiraceae bacterium]
MNNNNLKKLPEETLILFLHQYHEIVNNSGLNEYEQLQALHQLFSFLLEEITLKENISFPTLFSRLAYVGLQYKMNQSFLFYAHCFRKCISNDIIPLYARISLGKHVILQLLKLTSENTTRIPSSGWSKDIKKYFIREKPETIGFSPYIEALVIEVDVENFKMLFIDEKNGDEIKTAIFNVVHRNEIFNQNIISLNKHFTLPVPVNFIDNEITKDFAIVPKAFVLQPDLLIDVTSIAECFKENGSHSVVYLLNKFRGSDPKTPVLLGNIVNFLFEELVNNPDVLLENLTPIIFQKFGLPLTLLDDDELKTLWQKVETHFRNLKRVVDIDFKQLGIDKNNSFIESSFFSKKYGIQGRLDLFVFDEKTKTFAIVELKSGSPWKPNVYGISSAHFAQTQIYEMLIHSVYGKKTEYIKNYILYSKENEKALRFSPSLKLQQWEVLKVRNEIVILEELMKNLPENHEIFNTINLNDIDYLNGFLVGAVKEFQKLYQNLSSFEKKYFYNYFSFVAREFTMAKIGEHGIDASQGHAALWLENVVEKENRFAIITNLMIKENYTQTDDPKIIFQIDKDAKVSNFRKGDIALIYPAEGNDQDVLYSQVYKCTITDIQKEQVTVTLRNKQNNQTFFISQSKWNLEEDLIDSSFHKLYESLYNFLRSNEKFKELFLGLKPPQISNLSIEIDVEDHITSQQHKLIQKAIHSKDLFLIWGPPGTGKTNVVLKKIIKELFFKSNENILVLAYTNRAVDEICNAMANISTLFKSNFVRIGSKASTHPDFLENLLDVQIKNFNKRNEIKSFIQNKRIFVSTVSSILGKPEIFSLKSFETIIIDEASQILEPMLCGLLSKGARTILIGDHKQLPAVVRQNKKSTRISDEELLSCGFKDTSYSLFDRLFHQYKDNGWDHSYGILSEQGRMHINLQMFVDRHFYENQLAPLPTGGGQNSKTYLTSLHRKTDYLQNRIIFIHTPTQISGNAKINTFEASVCASVLKDLCEIYEKNNIPVTSQSFGIITPFRAQIAQIRKHILDDTPEMEPNVTIDTVERYQGGARDVILLSLCANNMNQLQRITSLNVGGIDRKMNVSLTRAREQIIMIGNKNVLESQFLYKEWIQQSKQFRMEDILRYQVHETD